MDSVSFEIIVSVGFLVISHPVLLNANYLSIPSKTRRNFSTISATHVCEIGEYVKVPQNNKPIWKERETANLQSRGS